MEGAVREIFSRYDTDNSGSIEQAEFKDICYDLGYFMSGAAFVGIDDDLSGSIDFDEFFTWSQSDKFEKFEAAKADALNTAIKMFREYDRDGNGSIDRREWLSIWKTLFGKGDEKLSKDDLRLAKHSMLQADKDKDGTVDLAEYLQWMKDLGVL